MPELADKGSAISPASDVLNLPGKLPRVPGVVIDRFPEMDKFQKEWDKWWSQVQTALSESNEDTATVVNQNYTDSGNIRVTVGDLTAEVTELTEVVIDGDAALARKIVTVSAMAGVPSGITVSGTAPVGPALNDYWIDTSDPSIPITYRWSGVAWVEVTDPISYAGVAQEQVARVTADTALATSITTLTATVNGNFTTLSASITTEATARANADSALATSIVNVTAAYQAADTIISASVTTEATARAAADGFLSGKYTLTVAAGDVVTGMNITSSSGSGTNISDVTFVATNFKIYNGTIGKTMFNVSGTDVQLAGTLTVSTSGKVYIGTGTFNNTNTAFYVDSAGQFSLKDKLSWNGTTLTVNGVVNSTSGTIGGFTIGASSLSAGSGGSYIALLSTVSSYGIQLGDDTTSKALIYRDGVTHSWTGTVNADYGMEFSGGTRNGYLRLRNSGALNIELKGQDGTANVTGGYKVSGTQVVGAQMAAISDLNIPGVDYSTEYLDIEGKINTIIARMRTWGQIAT